MPGIRPVDDRGIDPLEDLERQPPGLRVVLAIGDERLERLPWQFLLAGNRPVDDRLGHRSQVVGRQGVGVLEGGPAPAAARPVRIRRQFGDGACPAAGLPFALLVDRLDGRDQFGGFGRGPGSVARSAAADRAAMAARSRRTRSFRVIVEVPVVGSSVLVGGTILAIDLGGTKGRPTPPARLLDSPTVGEAG